MRHYRYLLIFSVLVFGIHFLLLQSTGVKTGGDTSRYILAAENALDGAPIVGKATNYLGYVGFLMLLKSCGLSDLGIIYFQVLLYVLASILLFFMITKLGGYRAGAISLISMAVNYDMFRWNTYLLTDSLYMSLVVISIFLISQWIEKKNWFWVILALMVSVLTSSIRPGWVMLAVVLWASARGYKSRWKRWSIYGACGAMGFIVLTALSIMDAGINKEDFGNALQTGMIVWGYEEWNISMPFVGELSSPKELVAYFFQYPLDCIKLGISRIGVALAHVRPYYSMKHNVLALVWGGGIYILAGLAYVRLKEHALCQLFGISIFVHVMIIGITFSDWDGRFILYTYPAIQGLAAIGGVMLFEKYSHRWRWKWRSDRKDVKDDDQLVET